MRSSLRRVIITIILISLVYFLMLFKLPYYIYKPGSADALDPIVSVEQGQRSEGDMHLVTVSSGQATPMALALAKVLPHHEIQSEADVFPEGIFEDEYYAAQLSMMENSQQAATVVGYEAADADIEIVYNGVYVLAIQKDMPAEKALKPHDRIYQIDEEVIDEADDLIDYIQTKKAGDLVEIHFERDETEENVKIELVELKDVENRIGIGIHLVTDREVNVDPKVEFASGNIGGSSAGLMFALEIYDQLTVKDYTKGLEIAGTGEVDYEGKVYPIGGVDKKVVAADKEGCDIFFVPNEQGAKDSNYVIAENKAKEIKTDMKIVPVDHFDDALAYLKKM